MDIEQLKLILETVNGVSGDAQVVAILWLVFDKLLPIIAWVGVFYMLCVKVANPLINAVFDESAIKRFRDELGTGSSGALIQPERIRTINKINDLIRESRKQ